MEQKKISRWIKLVLVTISFILVTSIITVYFLTANHFFTLEEGSIDSYVYEIAKATNEQDRDRLEELLRLEHSADELLDDFSNHPMQVKSTTVEGMYDAHINIWITCSIDNMYIDYLLVVENTGSNWRVIPGGFY